VFHHAQITREIRDLLGRGTDGASSPFLIPALSQEFLYFLVWMEENVAAGVGPENIILKLSELSPLHLRSRAAVRRDWTFSICATPLGISTASYYCELLNMLAR